MTIQVLTGDCRDVLATLSANSVHCCVTSPPYFGLRDYGTAQWSGGDPNCDHKKIRSAALGKSTLGPNRDGVSGQKTNGHQQEGFRSDCGHCGAFRVDRQIGLEPTPDAFVAEMVAVFREVRRVLRDDGTLWLNLGDSYNAAGRVGHGTRVGFKQGTNRASADGSDHTRPSVTSLKEKDLIGIPWRVAFALQADGWYLRQDIIWSKPNPMPESVTDRCTKAHEYIFLFSKSPRYFYDADAISEPAVGLNDHDLTGPGYSAPGQTVQRGSRSGNKERKPASARGVPVDTNGKSSGAVAGSVPWEGSTRNKRSVWTVGTAPFSEAHFATFPPALIEPCILAGCPDGGTVLDPFAGAGTTGLVADRLQRSAVLIEINPGYVDMARRRIHNDAPLFSEAAQ